jgi:hypothetical protein
MGISLYTFLIIQNPDNDLRCEPYSKNEQTGLWSAAIYLFHNGVLHTTVLSTSEQFLSPKIATLYMRGLLLKLKEVDLTSRETAVNDCQKIDFELDGVVPWLNAEYWTLNKLKFRMEEFIDPIFKKLRDFRMQLG